MTIYIVSCWGSGKVHRIRDMQRRSAAEEELQTEEGGQQRQHNGGIRSTFRKAGRKEVPVTLSTMPLLASLRKVTKTGINIVLYCEHKRKSDCLAQSQSQRQPFFEWWWWWSRIRKNGSNVGEEDNREQAVFVLAQYLCGGVIVLKGFRVNIFGE